MVPSIFNDNLFDSFFNDDFFWPETRRGADRAGRKLYGHRAGEIMKTDVKETEKGYEVAIDLPGFKKEDVTCELKDGYLTVSAEKKSSSKLCGTGRTWNLSWAQPSRNCWAKKN
jgi:HSP20 family molecular chaperone IbpA